MPAIQRKTVLVLAIVLSGAPLPASPPVKPPASGQSVLVAPTPTTSEIPEEPCAAGEPCETPSEERMLDLINVDRADPANRAETQGQAMPLKWDHKLAVAALEHSNDMAAHHYFSHFTLAGESPVGRFYEAGVQWRAMAENIAKNRSVEQAQAAFMSEPRFKPNHRGNILNPEFNYVGIGIVHGADGFLYITQDFAKEPVETARK